MLTGFGLLIALVAWLPLALKRLPLSLPIVCIALGAALFSLPQVTLRPLPIALSRDHRALHRIRRDHRADGRGAEDRPGVPLARWAVTWRLLAITMPLGILAITAIAAWVLGLPWAVALLLARQPGADRSGARRRRPGRPAEDRRGGRGALRPDLGSRAERRARLSVRPSRDRAGGGRRAPASRGSSNGSATACCGRSARASRPAG